MKRVRIPAPWSFLPPWTLPLRVVRQHNETLAPPWPDLLVSSGRQTIAPSIAIRKHRAGKTFTVHLQDPKVSTNCFDIIVTPRHDRRAGPNVISTLGAINRVTPTRLARAREYFAAALAGLPRPRLAILIGGSSKRHRMTGEAAARFGSQVASVARSHRAGLMVTPSRRTGEQNTAILRDLFEGLPMAFWDGTGENPYFGYLAWADAIIVTNDSISMVSEAGATGKPVHVAQLEPESPKFQRFHQDMVAAGITRPLGVELAQWRYEPLCEAVTVAAEVRRRMACDGKA